MKVGNVLCEYDFDPSLCTNVFLEIYLLTYGLLKTLQLQEPKELTQNSVTKLYQLRHKLKKKFKI